MKFLNFFVWLLVLLPCMAANGITNAEKTLVVQNARSYRTTNTEGIPVRPSDRRTVNCVSAFAESNVVHAAEIPKRPSLYRRTVNWVSAFAESDVVKATYKYLDLPVVAKNAFFGLADLVQSFMQSYSELFYKRISDYKDEDGRVSDAKVIAQSDFSAQSTPNNEDDSEVAKVEVNAQSNVSAQSSRNIEDREEDDSDIIEVIVIQLPEIDFAESTAGTESACSTQSAANENSTESVALATIEQTNAVQALETPQQSQQSQESRVDSADKGGITQLLSLSMLYCLFLGAIGVMNRAYARAIRRITRKILAKISALLAPKAATIEPTSYWGFPTESQYVFDIVHIDQTPESQPIVDYELVLNASDVEAALNECFENGYCGEPLTIAMLERLMQPPTLECGLGYADTEMPEDEDNEDEMLEQTDAHDNEPHESSVPQQPEPEQNFNEEETMERISGSDTGNEEPCLGASNVTDEVLIDEFAPEIYRVNWGGNALEIFGDSQRALSLYHYGATDITEQAWALGKFLPSIHQISSAVGLYLPEINAIDEALEYIKDLELNYDPGFDTGRIEKLHSRVHSLNLSQQEIEGEDLIGLTEEIMFAANLYSSGRLKHRHSRIRYQRRVRKTYEKVTTIVKKNVEALECATEAPENIINEYRDIVGELECKICTDGLFRQLYADNLD